LIADHQKSAVTAKELARLEKQKKLAQTLRLKAEAEEDGVDMERKKNWEWSIEENERWQAKMDEQKAKADSSFHSKLPLIPAAREQAEKQTPRTMLSRSTTVISKLPNLIYSNTNERRNQQWALHLVHW